MRRKYGNGRGGSADGYSPATHEEAELLEQLTPTSWPMPMCAPLGHLMREDKKEIKGTGIEREIVATSANWLKKVGMLLVLLALTR